MTSHQSSANKKAALYDFKVALKSIIAPTVLTFISSVILFIFSPVSTVFSYYFDVRMNVHQLRQEIVLALTGAYFGEYIGIYFLLIGAFFAVMSFSFIMNKKAVNVFFSTTVNRQTLYKNRISAAVIMIAASTAIPLLIDTIINVILLGNAGYVIKCAIALFAGSFVCIFAGFAIMSVAMTLCSTIIESLLFGVAAFGAPTAVVYFVDSFCEAFLNGYYHNTLISYYDGNQLAQPSLFHCTSIINPLLIGKAFGGQYEISDNIFNFVHRENDMKSWMSIGTASVGRAELKFDHILPILVWAIISVCLVLIAGKLFIKTKAENAGLHGTSAFAQRFFAVICVLVSCALWVDAVSYVYTDLSSAVSNTIITVLICLFIIFGMYTFIISICKRTIKHKAKEFTVPFSAAVGLAVFTIILSTGAFGYSTYVPDTDKIEKAFISTNVIDTTTSEFTVTPSENSYYDDIFSGYFSSDIILGVFEEDEDLKLLTDINKDLVEKTDNMTGSAVCVYYVLKNGKTVSRYYDSTDYDAAYRILSLRDSKAVKDELTYLLEGNIDDVPITNKLDGSSVDSYALFNYLDEKDVAYVLQGGRIYAVASDGLMNGNLIKNTPELRHALLTDLLSQTYEQRYQPNEAAIGGLYFSSSEYIDGNVFYDDYDYKMDSDIEQELGENVYYSSYEGGFYIYPSMTNTVNYLKSTGEYDLLAPQEDKIISICIENCKAVRDQQFEIWGNDSVITHQFATYNQYFTELLSENGEYYYEDADGYYYYSRQMTDYFRNGMVIQDDNKIEELMAKSRNYYYSDENDYIILVQYENKGAVSRLIPADEIPEWAIRESQTA